MKLLYVTSLTGKRINSFMRSAIFAAKQQGLDFIMACNTDMADKEGYAQDCIDYGITLEHIDFDRNPLAKNNRIAYRQLLELMNREHYDVVHCNTPIGGVLGRLCAKKAKIPFVIYQAHGFHFWKGAPLINWLVYYPVERYLARFTDLLITINNEDYQRARRFKIRKNGKVIKINGVGVPQHERLLTPEQISEKKKQLGIPNDAMVFLSVGELNENKNHIAAIKAFSFINWEALGRSWVYLICGQGELHDELIRQINENGLENSIKLLGFRSDIPELLEIANCFVFPSKREGLSAALMEAMEAGLPCVAGRIRGNVDLLPNSQLLFNPNDINELKECIYKSMDGSVVAIESENNKKNIRNFEFDSIVEALSSVYSNLR